MVKAVAKNSKLILVLAMALAVAISFMPISGSDVFAAQTDNTNTLSQVSKVTATNSGTGISLEWAKVTGATEYQIYRQIDNGKDYKQIGTSKTNSFIDDDVTLGAIYSYKIRACQTNEKSTLLGPFSQTRFSRTSVVSTALAWLGCKESDGSFQKVIDVYNTDMGTNVADKNSWSAVFVSAVAIESKTASIIATGSNNTLVNDTYKTGEKGKNSYVEGNKYTPKVGDIVFFDWDKNGKPNNTGIVASVSSNTIKTIEGNLDGAVGYRTFPIGYAYVLGYGLPNYDDADGIVYTGAANISTGCGELEALGIGTEPEGYDDLGKEYDFVEQKVIDNIGDDQVSQYDKMVYITKKVKTNGNTEGINCSKAQYYVAFIYKLCQVAGIDASIITAEDENGNTKAWIEMVLDGQWYTINDSVKIEKQ